jgi:hypothetical protein
MAHLRSQGELHRLFYFDEREIEASAALVILKSQLCARNMVSIVGQ